MTEERLKEIHDSIEFQMQLQQAIGYKSRYDDLLVEEIDLYKEVIELQQERNNYKELYEKEKEKNEKAIEYLTNGYLINTRELKSILNGELSDIEKSLNRLRDLK